MKILWKYCKDEIIRKLSELLSSDDNRSALQRANFDVMQAQLHYGNNEKTNNVNTRSEDHHGELNATAHNIKHDAFPLATVRAIAQWPQINF